MLASTNCSSRFKRYDLSDVGRYRLNRKLNLSTPTDIKVLTKEDIIAIISHLIRLINSKATVDDNADHLSNRPSAYGGRTAGQFSVGLSRMARTIKERDECP